MQYQQHPSSGVITLPLLKFSAANDEPAEATNFSWKHTTQNLMVHFDTFSGAAGSHIMKVLQGTHNVLESVDLQEKISACSQVIDTMRQHNIEIRNEQLPISALVRCPLFAFRYNLPDRKVRRVQLKFASNEGFEMAYNHLSRLGLRITQSVPPSTTTKPASSNNNTPSTFSHAPQAAIIAERPHTAQDTLRPEIVPQMIGPPSHQDRPPSLVQSDHVSAPIRSTSIPPRHVSPEETHFPRPASAYSALSNYNHLSNNLPVPESYQNPAYSSPVPAYTPAHSMPVPTYIPAQSTPAPANTPVHSESSLPTFSENEITTSSSRPVTALLYQPDPTIPPRRELPFKRCSSPKSSGTDKKSSSRPSSSAMEPPPIPIRSETSGSARPSNIIFNLPPLPRPTLVREMNKENEAVRDSIQSTSQSFHPLRNMTQNTQQSQPSLQSQFTNPTNAENPTPFVDRVISHIIAQGSSGTEQLANYAKRPSDERAPALDDYLLQYLEDESFVTLCEDVSACWRRICFED